MRFMLKVSLAAAIIFSAAFQISAERVFASADEPDEISIPVSQVLDWRVEDIDGSGTPVLLIIRKRDKADSVEYDDRYENGIAAPLPGEVAESVKAQGLVFGNDFLICEYPGHMPDLSDPDGVLWLKKIFIMDFTAVRPMSIKTGDVDGDGLNEISICVFKTTRFHPVYAKRPFLYRYDGAENRLVPVWLGSRLSRPFDDYLFADINGDGIDELVSTETDRNGNRVITCYYWWDFGFYKLGESRPYENIISIRPYSPPDSGAGLKDSEATVVAELEIDGVSETAGFIYIENENPDPSEDYGRLETVSITSH